METPRAPHALPVLPPELILLSIEQNLDAFDPQDLLSASLACRALAGGLRRLDDARVLGAWLGAALRRGAPGLPLGPDGVELDPMLEGLRELQREPGRFGGGTPQDAAAPLAATAACALLSWRRLEGAGPEQLLAALLAALEAAGAGGALAAARAAAEAAPQRLGDLAPLPGPEASCWQPQDGSIGAPSAQEMATGAAFAAAAWGALGGRALLLAPFAAAGGRDALATALVGHCVRRYAGADDGSPTLSDLLGLTLYDFSVSPPQMGDFEPLGWLLGACAAAAGRRGHAGACARLVGREEEVWGGMCVNAAAAGGHVELLQELLAGGPGEVPLVKGLDRHVMLSRAVDRMAMHGRAAELGRFLEWCELRPPPAQPDELPGSEDPHAVPCFYPRFIARLAAGPNGPAVLRTLLAFDRRRADAGELDDPCPAPRSAASPLFWVLGVEAATCWVTPALVAALAPPACIKDHLTAAHGLSPGAFSTAALAALQEAAAMAAAGPAAVTDALPPLVREALAAVEVSVREGRAPMVALECLEAAAAVAMAACDAATAEAVLRAASRPAAVRHLKAAAAPLDGASLWDCLGALAGQGGGGGGGGGTRGASRARVLRAQLAERRASLAGQRGGQAEALQALLQAGLVERADDLAAAMPQLSVQEAAARALGALQPGGRWVSDWADAQHPGAVVHYSTAQWGKLGLLHDARCAGWSAPCPLRPARAGPEESFAPALHVGVTRATPDWTP
jgi:hypothetical protein